MYCVDGGAVINIGDGADWRADGRWAGYSICLGLCKFGSCTGQILSVSCLLVFLHGKDPFDFVPQTKPMTTC